MVIFPFLFFFFFYICMSAIQLDKVNLKMYCAWSLLDNFEWCKGYSIRFGFFHVNFEDPARPRVPYASAKEYAKVIRNNGLEGHLQKRWMSSITRRRCLCFWKGNLLWRSLRQLPVAFVINRSYLVIPDCEVRIAMPRYVFNDGLYCICIWINEALKKKNRTENH